MPKIHFILITALSILMSACGKSDGAGRGSQHMPQIEISKSSDALADSKIDGVWLLLDRGNNYAPESVVVVYNKNGRRYMKMVAIYHGDKIDDTMEKPLEKAKGIDGNPPLCGMDFVWDLVPADGGKYVGHVVDPDSGSVYKCKVWYDESKKKLVMRGELLIFGENEYLVPFDINKLPFKIDISKFSPNIPKLD
jgi:hypothetical protein